MRSPFEQSCSKQLPEPVPEHSAQDRCRTGERLNSAELQPIHGLKPTRAAGFEAKPVHPGPVLALAVQERHALVADGDFCVCLRHGVVPQHDGVVPCSTDAERRRSGREGNRTMHGALELGEEADLIGVERLFGISLHGR